MPLEPITGHVQYTTDTGPVDDLVTALRELTKANETLTGKLDDVVGAGDRSKKSKEEETQRTLDVNAALQETSRILGGLTAVYADALAKSTEFGSAMGQVATLSTEVSGNLDAYNQQVLQLSSSMGVDAKQAADTFYQAISSGAAADAAGGLRIVETALKASVGGATDAATAVDGITTAMNAWKESNVTATQASDILFKSVALGKCVTGDTRVLLADGRYERIDRLQDGAQIVAYDEAGDRLVVADAEWIDQGEKPVARLVTASGRSIGTTFNHPYLTPDGWKRVEELQPGDEIAVPTHTPYFGDEDVPEERAILLALLLCEGTLLTGSPRVSTTTYGDEVERCADHFDVACRNVEKRSGFCPQWALTSREGRAGPRTGNHVLEWLRGIGYEVPVKAGDKYVADCVFSWSRESVALFLRWMFNCDGWLAHLNPSRRQYSAGFCSKSERLVRDVAHLCLRFGINGKVRFRAESNAWVFEFTDFLTVRLFCEEIGIDRPACARVLAEDITPPVVPQDGAPWERTVRFERIESITAEPAQHVYDLTVPGYQNFIAADILAHNTTMGEMSAALFQAGPLAASVGISMEEVAAATATLTKSGTPTSAAMTQIRASMVALVNPNAQLQTILESLAKKFPEMGEASGQAALDTFGYHKSLQLIVSEADELGVALPAALGSVEAMGAALGVSGANAATAMSDLEGMNNAAGETDKAYETMANTFGFASNQLRETANAALIEIGTTLGQMLVPVMQRVTQAITSLMEGWSSLDDGTKQAIVTIGGLVALIGSGLGVFLTLSSTIKTIGPLFTQATGGVTMFSGALAATGIGVAVLAIGALVKGVHDASAAFDEANAEAVAAGGGYDAFAAAADRAGQKMGTLGKIGAAISWGVGETAKVREATAAWLEHGLGVDEAVLASSRYQQEELKLSQQLTEGSITADQYRASLLEVASAESVASGHGYVLAEAQREQATSLAQATAAALEKTGAVGAALAKDEEWARTNESLSEKVAAGEMTLQQYRIAMDAYTASRAEQVAADQRASEATAQAAGKLQSYSSEFAKLSGAGSKWVADQQEMARAVEEAWAGLSGGVEQNLQDQYASYQKYQEDLAAAREADAQAAAAAGQKRADAEASHNEKMIELNARMEDAKTEKQRAAAEKAIAKENEKLQGILSATESVGGANVAKVEAQYAEQVEAQREALAQMVVDHVTNMVLMGQTSEDTAKTIFATLREAYPGVEVFSPVADAHVELMATIRDATDESSASQVESIARLPDAMNGALGQIQATADEHNATIDSWATADEVLAARAEEAGARTGAASAAAADAVEAGGGRARQSYDETGQVALGYAGTTEEAGARVGTAASVEADAVSEQHGRARQSYDETGQAAGTYASTVDRESQRAAAGVQAGAEGMKVGLQGVQRELDSTSLKSSATAGNLTRNLGGLGAGIEASAKRGKAALSDLDQQLLRTSETSQRVGAAGEEGFGAGADAAEEAASGVTSATDDMGKGADEATEKIEVLRKGLEELPPETELSFAGIGLDDLIADVRRLRLELDAMARAFGNAGNAAGATAGGKQRQNPFGAEGGGGGGGGANGMEIPVSILDRSGGLLTNTGGRIALQDYLDALAGADYRVVVTPVLDDEAILEQIEAARAEAERLLAVLEAQQTTFMRGGAAEDGSLAWILGNWQSIGMPADIQQMMAALNVPVSTIEEFRAHWDALDPAGRAELWKRLYDDLRQMEKDRHDQAVANIEDEVTVQIESMVNGQRVVETLTKRQLQSKIDEIEALIKSWEGMDDKGNETEAAKAILAGLEAKMMAAKAAADDAKEAENARHEQVMAGLEAENKMLGRQFDDWKAGLKAIADLEKQRDDARKAFVKAVRDEQKETEETEKQAHTLALQMLSDLAEAEEKKHDARMKLLEDEREAEDARHKAATDRLKKLQSDENDAHDARMVALDAERARERSALDGLEASMLQLKIEMAELRLDTSSLEHAQSLLDGLKSALSDMPDRADRRRNPTGQIALDERARAALQEALASGKLSPEDARRAERVLAGQKLGLEQMRALLEHTAELNEETVSQEQAKIDAKQREIDMLQLQIDREKLRFDQADARIKAQEEEENRLHDAEMKRMAALEQAEKDRHDREVAGIKAREDAEKAAWDAFEERLNTAKRAEDERHKAKLRQIEAEFRARLIAEGLIEEAGRDPEEALRKAQAIADQIFGALRGLVGSGSDAPPEEPKTGAGPAVTPDPASQVKKQTGTPARPPGIVPEPPKQVKGWPRGAGMPPEITDTAPAILDLDDALQTVTMTLAEWGAMLDSTVRSGESAGFGGAGGGPASYSSVANFYAPVIIPDDEEEAALLRQSLGSWGTRGRP